MIVAPRNIASIAPIPEDRWEVAFKPSPEAKTEACPVIGWATVVISANENGAYTEVRPAFLWGDTVWTEFDLAEHAPDFVGYSLRRPRSPFAEENQ
ncbi:hypothetical protein [Streptomyces europaeiscabiei]|uniref:hypothetical protein n=1 Tax=Streptomyces europaeiscabiei TaxID=146819 RepID=UPI0029AFD5FB|nr:hypothetical protein [Streptomyces europaeiscabiei]MDX3582973.1 hypothetical protein [Streptomyces europaeiscabiei]